MRQGKKRNRKGATTVEFAVAAVTFFTLIFGAFQFGGAIFQYNIVANATKAAVRWSVVRGSSSGQTAATPAQIHDYILTQMQGYTEVDTVSWLPSGNSGRGDTVKVVVRGSYVINLFGFGTKTIPLRSAAKMIIAR